MKSELRFYYDTNRHLVCLPFSIPNLHEAAKLLGIKRHWFHSGRHPHYDIPKREIENVTRQATLISSREVYKIIHGELMEIKKPVQPEITQFDALVEVHHLRGVIYVHLKHPVDLDRFQNATAIRICGMPQPIPALEGFQLDMNLGRLNNGKSICNWRGDGTAADDVHKDTQLVIDKVEVKVDEKGIASASATAAKPLIVALAEKRNNEARQACINEGTHGLNQIPPRDGSSLSVCESCGCTV